MADTDLWLSEIDRILSDIDASAQWSLCGKLAAARNDALRQYVYALRDLERENCISMEEENEDAIDTAQAAVTRAFDDLIEAQQRLDRSADARERYSSP